MDSTPPEVQLELLTSQLQRTFSLSEKPDDYAVPVAEQEKVLAGMVDEMYHGDGPLAAALAGNLEVMPLIVQLAGTEFASDPVAVDLLQYAIARDLLQMAPDRVGLNPQQAAGLLTKLDKAGEVLHDSMAQTTKLGPINRSIMSTMERARSGGLLHLSQADAIAKNVPPVTAPTTRV